MGKIGVIVQREFNTRVKKKSFIITTILMPLLMLGLMAAPVILMQIKSGTTREILVVDNSGLVADKLQDGDNMVFTPSDASYEELRERKAGVFGILVIGEDVLSDPHNVQLYTYEASTVDMEDGIAGQIRRTLEEHKLALYDIEGLDRIMEEVKTPVSLRSYRIDGQGEEKASSSGLAMGLAYLFGFLIYMFVIIYGSMVMQGVIEEKSSRVMEIMVSSVRPFELMMGKILGIAAVAVTQFVIWVVFIAAAGGALMSLFAGDMLEAAQQMQAGMPVDTMGLNIDRQTLSMISTAVDPSFLLGLAGSFLVYFIGGYLLYAAMFAAIGSAVDNAEDTSQLQIPVTVPIILALLIMFNVMKDPNSALAVWSSMIPFTSPVIMMARIPYGVPAWQIAASIVILCASFVAMVWFAGKIYRVGIFMYGKKPTLREVLKWSKYRS